MTRLRPVLVVAIALLASGATAPPLHAAAHPPAPGKVYAGVTGGLRPSDFTSWNALVGKHAPVWNLFLTYGLDLNTQQYVRVRLSQAPGLQTRLMLSLTTANRGGREVVTPAGLASGLGDQYLLILNREIAAAGQIVYVRPLAEMNQASNVYSAYGRGGYRGASHSTANFKKAWRRLTLILRGGDVGAINRALAAQGMPALRGAAGALPAPQVALVWCPQVAGNPNLPGNSARAYYPGSAYVDWLCTDFYSGFPNFSGLNRFYAQFASTGKPFAFGEYGIYPGGDAPGFVARLFAFVRGHSRLKMVLFNQGNRPGGRFRLQRYPRSAAVVRSALRDPRFVPLP